ncbi:MAG TPA: PBP1A family penicillin-binding protein [Candidatus Limivicinus faecipullorum]|nr:PBP1A family penicillin-binding protein [Candidatus Limivicinus faecipullorum]
MSKKSPDVQDSEKKSPEPQPPKNKRYIVKKAANVTGDLISGSIGAVLKVIGTILLIFLVAGMMFTCVFAYYVKTCLVPSFDLSLEDMKLNESSTLWYQDASGEWRELATLSGKEKRVWVDYEDLPWYLEKALVAIEDKRFYEHKGVDWYRTAGAFVTMFAKMDTSYGGSTITQQLIKNLTGKDDVTIQRKLSEIFGALELEKRYDKQEIVEWYLNAVYFGQGAYGVQMAAQTYFGKDAKDLTLAECAAIVGITNLPTYYDPFYNEQNNKDRQETILREMYEQGYIDYQQYKDAVAEELVFTRSPGEEYSQTIYSYYTEVVIDDVVKDLMQLKGISEDTAKTLLYNGGYNVYTCLDINVQNNIDAIYTDLEAIPNTWGSDQQLQSAIVVMDPYDGRILGLSGGVGEKTINFGLNRATGTKRPPGSSIKPLSAYGPAIDLGLITPETTVMDSPNVVLNGIDWLPANDSRSYMGLVTIYTALQYSINTVAAQIVDILPQGPQTSYDYLVNHLGFTSLVPEHDIAYAPMSLGQFYNGCTVREMAQAYCSIVNDGIFTYSRTYTMLTDSEGSIVIDNTPRTIQAFEPNTAYTLTYMLQNAVEHGTGTEAALWSVPVAGKTGSSGQYMDRWFVGCTPYYVAAVWTGYDQQEAIQVSGNPAAQLWKKVMSPLHDGLAWKSFTYPYLSGENTGIFGYTDPEEDEYLDDFITTDPDTGSTGGTIIGGDQFSDNWTGGTTGDIWGGGTTGDIWGGDSSGNWGGSGADDPFLSGGGDNMFIW